LNRQSIEQQLVSGLIDMSVALTSNIQNPDIETVTLMKSPRRLWVPTGHPMSDMDKVSLQDIGREPYIMLTVDEAAHTSMKYWNANNCSPNIKLRTSSVEAVRSLVANGQGVTILSDMVYRPWSLEGRRIETVQTSVEIPTMDVGMALRRQGTPGKAIRVLRDYFQQSFLSPKSTLG
jgi:DNA-binding transcriptional LysR family regulator